jgi:hypothetical protein
LTWAAMSSHLVMAQYTGFPISIHLRDMKGDLRSFMKSELKEIKLPREFLMPDYASLSKVDLENLVGYLGSLRQKRRAQ